jgi:hypothetical protein
LLMLAMLIASVVGAEVNFRRNLERRARLAGRPSQPARS